MWALNNQTSYAAERNWIRDKLGGHHWVVAVKATFDIGLNGKLTLAHEQKPPVLAPEYHGEPGTSSLRLDSDLLGVRPCTNVVLDAFARAPAERPASSVTVSLAVGRVAKMLVVHGDRRYTKGVTGGVTTSSPRAFITRPIRYERSHGGADLSAPDPAQHTRDRRNPIGVGFAADRGTLIGKTRSQRRVSERRSGCARAGRLRADRPVVVAAARTRRHLRRELGAHQEATPAG